MTAVLYTCPIGDENCGRFFLSPGGTSIHCRHHPEERLIQREHFGGADSMFVDESGKTKSQGHIVTAGVETTPAQKFADPPAPTATVPEEQILRDLRAEYELVSGYKADKRWKEQRLRDEIAYEKEEAMAEEVHIPTPPVNQPSEEETFSLGVASPQDVEDNPEEDPGGDQ